MFCSWSIFEQSFILDDYSWDLPHFDIDRPFYSRIKNNLKKISLFQLSLKDLREAAKEVEELLEHGFAAYVDMATRGNEGQVDVNGV